MFPSYCLADLHKLHAWLRPCTELALHVHKNVWTVLLENTVENYYPHRPLCFKKIRTTTTTVILIPTQQSQILTVIVQHSILNLLHPCLKFNRSLSVWYYFMAELEVFGTKSWSMVSILDLFHCFQSLKNGSAET